MKKRIEYLIKNNRIVQVTYKIVGSLFFRFLGCFVKVNKNRILFSGHGGKINDSSYKIYLRMIEMKQFENYIFTWAVNRKTMLNNPNIKTVEENTFRYFIETLRSKYWIATVNMEKGLNYKKRKQIYLNTGHGIPMNTIGNAAAKRKDFNFSNIDYFCVSSDFEIPLYIRDYKLNKKSILLSGMPRNDDLFVEMEQNDKNHIKNMFNIPITKKIILYAPTWRESVNKGKDYDLNLPLDISKWRKTFSDDYVIIIRLHPFITGLINIDFDDFVIDVSHHEEVNDLIQIADILITDYSSIFFDFSITEKPIFLYAYDLEEYIVKRGLYLNPIDKFKSITFKSEQDLMDAIKNESFDYPLIKQVKKKYHKYSGNSCDKIIKLLFGEFS